MMDMKLLKVLEIIDGEMVNSGRIANRKLCGVSTDSRTIKKGELFFALKGSNYDGHEFTEVAIKKSGLPAVVERKVREDKIILVENTLESLGKLACYYRELKNPYLIAVTGSFGKTTTKEFLGAVFSNEKPTLISYRNFNNLIGVPLNIFRLEDEEIAILELASNKKGEIKILSEISNPDAGIITGIGHSHLEAFKSREGVFKEKTGILEGLNGPLFVNGDDDLLRDIEFEELITYGLFNRNDYVFKILHESSDGSVFSAGKDEFHIFIPTRGALFCAMAAATVALYHGIPSVNIQKGFNKISVINHRMQIIKKYGFTIIDDTYNSNPDSLMNCVNLISKIPGRKIAVLGPMLELGTRSYELHRKIGEKIRDRFDKIIVIGDEAKGFIEGFKDGIFTKDKKEAYKELKKVVAVGDVILFKSSHSIHLETLVLKMEEICSTSFIR